ncbi:MAG: type II secretion system minor pseudopilin GspK [bacterium]|nr:type II secretion system minor pseudopilin GspK [bacterium]
MQTTGKRRAGLALLAVMFFILLAVSGIATFLRRATIDGMVVRNRDFSARSEVLARGGIRLATALLLQDRLDETEAAFRAETRHELWAQVGASPLLVKDGGELRLRIEDAGARLNLNALVQDGTVRDELAEGFLVEVLDRVIQEIPGGDEERSYDAEELAQNLLDYLDEDNVGITGSLEDDYYQRQEPSYRAANRPLLSVDELGLVQGFSGPLVEALRPYVSVYPLTGGDGINPNTAAPWVLALLYHGTTSDYRLAVADTVRDILELREAGDVLCESSEGSECIAVGEAIEGEIFPPLTFQTDVFRVEARARYGDVERTVTAWLDRSDPAEPHWLAWDIR